MSDGSLVSRDSDGKLSARDYTSEDRLACLALFDSNVPEFFAASERDDYSIYLDRLPCAYLVLSSPRDGTVAAGGYYVSEDRDVGGLAWGLVIRSWPGTRRRQAIAANALGIAAA